MTLEPLEEEQQESTPLGRVGSAVVALLATLLIAGMALPSGQEPSPEPINYLDGDYCAATFARLSTAHELLLAMDEMPPDSAKELDARLASYLDLNRSGRLTGNDVTLARDVLLRMQSGESESCAGYTAPGVDAKTYATEIANELLPLLRAAAVEEARPGHDASSPGPPLSALSRGLKRPKA